MYHKTQRKIAVIGYGRLGKLLCSLLRTFGDVFVIDVLPIRDRQVRQIDYPWLGDMDWVIPAVPISALEGVLKEMAPFLREGSLVMDVCSVKVHPCRWLMELLPETVQVIGSHPMFGPDSAQAGLKGLQMVLCPLRQSDETLEELRSLFRGLGLELIETTPEDHDRQTALSLSLVHFIGRALGGIGFAQQKITTRGLERLLAIHDSVNNDTWGLFFDMQKYNPYADETRMRFMDSLLDLEVKISEKT